MIIVHALHHYFPVVGGIERAVQYLAESQAKLGHEIHVVASKFGAEGRPDEEVINGVYVHRVPSRRLYYPDLTIPKALPLSLLRKADVVHVHSHNSMFSVDVLEKARKFGVRTACYFMAIDSFKDHPNPLIRFVGPVYGRHNTQRAIKAASLRLVKNARDLEILRKRYNSDATLLPDGVPRRYIETPKVDAEQVLKKYKIRHSRFFLYIGRIHKLKGPHILAQAMRYLDDTVAAVLVGPDNGYLNYILNIAEKAGLRHRLYYLGYVSEEEKIALIDSAVAVVVPSISDYAEAYSIVISEAWAREKPVVASTVGALPYRVRHGINGLLVKPQDPRLLAEALKALLADENYATSLGKEGKREVMTWDDIATRSVELYRTST